MDPDAPAAGYAQLSATGSILPTRHGWKREFNFFGFQLSIYENRPEAVWGASYGLVAWNAALVLCTAFDNCNLDSEQLEETEQQPHRAPLHTCLTHIVPGWPKSRWAKAPKILEIGAGTGILGLTLASVGARVMLTDYQPAVLEQLKANIQLNSSLVGTRAETRRLDWSEMNDVIQLLHEEAMAARSEGESSGWDMIVAADVLCECLPSCSHSCQLVGS